jgi:hypothetical protein
MSDERAPVERLLDLAVFAPIGMLTALRDELPKFSQQGRQVVQNRIVLARFIGQMAVQQGQREVAKRLEARRTAPPVETTAVEAVEPADQVKGGSVPGGADADAPSAADLPIAGYESLPALNVVQRLATLLPEEVELVRQFEQAHRARRTILAKIDQLQGR